MPGVIGRLLKRFYLVIAIALILLAVVVQLGRSFSYLASDYADEIGAYLSERIGLQVEFRSLQIDWRGLRPQVAFNQVRLRGENHAQILTLDNAQLHLDLWGSLIRWNLHWHTIQVDGGAVEFWQDIDGRWQIPGLGLSVNETDSVRPATEGSAPNPDDVFELFLLGTRIHFQDTQLTFRFADHHLIQLEASELLLENSRDFHRLTVNIDIDDRRDSAQLVVEGRGDPRNLRQLRTQGYLLLQNVPTMEPLVATVSALLGRIDQPDWGSRGYLDAQIWFNSRISGEGFDLQGRLALADMPVPVADRDIHVQQLSTDITGYWLRTGAWHLALQSLSASWDQSQWGPVDVAVAADNHGAPLELMLAQADLATVVQLLESNQLLDWGFLHSAITTLAPRGAIQDVRLTLPLDDPAEWQISAWLENAAANPWQGVPGLSGVTGRVQADRQGGYVDLDSRENFSMFYQGIYQRPMHYQWARGQVAWHLQPDNNRVYVNSGPLSLGNQTMVVEETALGYMWLSLPWSDEEGGDQDLYLYIGARDASAGLYRKYVPQLVSQDLRNWLERSLGGGGDGVARRGEFVYRGTLNTPVSAARTHQLALDIENAALNYYPGWPPVRNVSGRLSLDDEVLSAHIERGHIYNSDVADTQVTVAPNPQGAGSLLTIDGDVHGIASDGLRVLRESLLRQYVGNNMDAWYIHGSMNARMHLAIPLAEGQPGSRQLLDIQVDASTMAMDNIGLEVADVRGRLHYDNVLGLKASNLQGRLFGEDLQVSIESVKPPEQPPETHIQIATDMDMANLTAWLKRPELMFLRGKTRLDARIELTHLGAFEQDDPDADQDVQQAAISVKTDLKGVTVNLPEGLGKAASDARPLNLGVVLGQQTLLAHLDYHEGVDLLVQVQRENQQLLSANLALGADAQLPETPQLLLSGYLERWNPETWQTLLEDYQGYAQQLNPGQRDPVSVFDPDQLPPIHTDLVLRHHTLGPLILEDLHLRAAQQPDTWQVQFNNALMAGELIIPDNDGPMQLTFDYLHYLQPDENEFIDGASLPVYIDPPDVFDPRQLPDIDVIVSDFWLNEKAYGQLRFRLRTDANSAQFTDIYSEIRELVIQGVEPGQGASLSWSVSSEGRQQTRLDGRVRADNLADVSRAWELPEMIESQQAVYDFHLSWDGAPQDFTLHALRGTVDMEILNGRFTRNPSAGSDGILRLFAVLNFDSLARRLRLDFSDLYQSGLAYDEIRGRVSFDRGTMTFLTPLQVRSPSSRLQMAGRVNLLEETLDTRLIATLPVAGNLTFLTALAAGLPAAAGVYLVSKLFERQVDRATSITYTIQGGWDQPQIRFDRMFESDAALRVTEPEQGEESR